ncbi:MAG TPA: c-type cytochrome, partial [Nitrosospira sp.]|nr:c-type cytochrome [Nitrosospira sp.]
IYATNLTPDKKTGIGNWSDEAFLKAVREGVGSNGHLYPAMPYTSYAAMSRDDVLAIKEYLLTLEPVEHTQVDATLSFPFNQRWGMAAWNLVFFRERRFVAPESGGAVINRGAYLANALGHCAECHTPRNIGFALKSKDYLSGAEIEGWKAYNTTPNQAYGIGAWTDEQLTSYLSTGHAPGRSSAAGPMAEVIEHSLQYLTRSDIKALAAYMRQVTPLGGENTETVNLEPTGAAASNAVLPGSLQRTENLRGKQLFAADCVGCHQWNGAGRQTQYASLVGSRSVNDPSGAALIQVILKGASIRVGSQTELMPAFGSAYSDADVAALANYVIGHFADKRGEVTAEQVSSRRSAK